MRSAATSSGSANVSVIDSGDSISLAPSCGTLEEGAAMSVARVSFFPEKLHVKRVSAGHGSAGRNWRVRESIHVNAPG